MEIPNTLFKNHRYPAEIIQYTVWLYFVFPLSFRDVEPLLYGWGSLSVTKRFGLGVINLDPTSHSKFVVNVVQRPINGILTRCL